MLAGIEGTLLTLVAFVLVLGVVVVVHEFGHFQVARWCGIAVKSFSLGMGPPVASVQDKHGTTWKISAIPVGGFVSWLDDTDPTSTRPATEESRDLSDEEARRRGYFHAQPVLKRAAVTLAGPLTNFLFSIVAFAALVMIVGRDVTPVASLSARIDGVAAEGPAATAGLRAGDVITAIDGTPVTSFGRMQEIVRANPGKTVTFTLVRDGATTTAPVTIGGRADLDRTGVETRKGFLGVERQTQASERRLQRFGPIGALGAGATQVWDIISSTGAYVGNVFSGKASAAHISGPAGIFAASGTVAKSAISGGGDAGEKLARLALSLLAWAATLSVAVGIVNLLPVPILDGGHLLFYGIEAARGRPLGPKAQEFGYRAGLAFVASLFLFATWNDLQRFKLLEFLGGMLS